MAPDSGSAPPPLRAAAASGVESRYAWLRLAAAVALGTIGGVGLWSIVLTLPAVQAEFGVARAGASLPYALTMLGFMAGGVLMGRLADRFGVFVPAVVGSVALGLGYVATAFAGSLWLFAVLYAALIGMLGSSAVFAPLVADTSLWFSRRRGIAVALCASGNYIAGAVWPPVLQPVIEAVGWRTAHLGIGVFCLATMLPLAFALRRPTPGLGAAPRRGRRRRRARRRRPSACDPARCRRCWSSRASRAAWRWRCRRCTSSPTAWTSATARRAGRRCCR